MKTDVFIQSLEADRLALPSKYFNVYFAKPVN